MQKQQSKSGIEREYPGRYLLAGFFLLALILSTLMVSAPTLQAQSCTPVVDSASLENGEWNAKSSDGYPVMSNYNVYSGATSAYLGGIDNAADSLNKTVALPQAEEIKMSFWWMVDSEENSSGWDSMNVIVADASGAALRTLYTLGGADAATSWQLAEADLTDFAGQTVQIQFEAATDGSLVTDFFVDDVEVSACASSSSGAFEIFLPFTQR